MFNGTLYVDDAHYPQADRFIPERWLRDETAKCPVRRAHETHPFVYLPFGHGARACPGMRFANMEMETLIARVDSSLFIMQFDLFIIPFRSLQVLLDYKLEWKQPDMTFNSQFLQSPASPLKLTLLDRE